MREEVVVGEEAKKMVEMVLQEGLVMVVDLVLMLV